MGAFPWDFIRFNPISRTLAMAEPTPRCLHGQGRGQCCTNPPWPGAPRRVTLYKDGFDDRSTGGGAMKSHPTFLEKHLASSTSRSLLGKLPVMTAAAKGRRGLRAPPARPA